MSHIYDRQAILKKTHKTFNNFTTKRFYCKLHKYHFSQNIILVKKIFVCHIYVTMSTTTFYCHLHMTFRILDYILKDCFVHMYILTINRSLISRWIVNIVAMYHDIRLTLLFHFCTSCNSWQSDYIRLYRDAFHRIPLFWSYYESCILYLKQTSRKLCFGYNT